MIEILGMTAAWILLLLTIGGLVVGTVELLKWLNPNKK